MRIRPSTGPELALRGAARGIPSFVRRRLLGRSICGLCLHVPLRYGHLQKLEEYATDPRMASGSGVRLSLHRSGSGTADLRRDAGTGHRGRVAPRTILDTPEPFRGRLRDRSRPMGRVRDRPLSDASSELENAEAEGDSAAINGGRVPASLGRSDRADGRGGSWRRPPRPSRL